ncbi:hypothetical protein [Planctomycetes bacterium Pan216]
MKQKRTMLLSIGVAPLLLGGALWAWWPFGDPQVVQARALAKQAFSEEARKLPEEQRRELGKQFRDHMESLTPEQRREVFNNEDRRRRDEERLNAFFLMPPEKRTEYLDNMIDEMQKRRKEWEKRRKERAQNESARKDSKDGRGNDRRRGDRPRRTAEDRVNRRQDRLNDSSAQERAKRTEFFTQLRNRMKERGISSGWGRRGR